MTKINETHMCSSITCLHVWSCNMYIRGLFSSDITYPFTNMISYRECKVLNYNT